jgi:hypothetical protein
MNEKSSEYGDAGKLKTKEKNTSRDGKHKDGKGRNIEENE